MRFWGAFIFRRCLLLGLQLTVEEFNIDASQINGEAHLVRLLPGRFKFEHL